MPHLSACVLAYNQAAKLRDCLASVQWADEIVVVDSHSTDATAAIARELGARVEQVEFAGFGRLRNRAIELCRGDWIFSLDSDERCTPAARDAIQRIVRAGDAAAHDYYFVPRRNYFLGRRIRHSGWYPNFRQPQLFRRGCVTYDDQPVHEGYVVHSARPAGVLPADIRQVPFASLDEAIAKMNRYSTLGAEKLAQRGRPGSYAAGLAHASWAFLKHYLLKRGLLDGWAGFIIAFGYFEVTFYRYAKHCAAATPPPPWDDAPAT